MSNTDAEDDADSPDCRRCPLAERREFLRHAGMAALGAFVMVGMPPGLAAVTPSTLRRRRWAGKNPSYSLPTQDGVQIDRENDVILVRWKGEVIAFNLSCPHQNTALRWNEADAQFQCPKHHSKYQPDGTFISGRATRNMDRFSLARRGDEVVVNIDAMHKNDQDPSGWGASVMMVGKGG